MWLFDRIEMGVSSAWVMYFLSASMVSDFLLIRITFAKNPLLLNYEFPNTGYIK